MSEKNSPPPSPPMDRRRSSIAGQWADLIHHRNSSASGIPAYPGPISAAAQAQQRRRLSLTTVGLTGSPNQTSPFANMRPRGESISSANSSTVDESPFEDADAPPVSSSMPSTPFARRMSFGARAMRETRGSAGAAAANGRAPISSPTAGSNKHSSTSSNHGNVAKAVSPPAAKGRGEGFNFADNLRTRAERSSISAASGASPITIPSQNQARNVPVMEPPKQVHKPRTLDPTQERILKGDFYMD